MSSIMDDVKLFQQFCIRFINPKVRQHFKDINVDDNLLDTNNSRHVAKLVCLHKDNDPIALTHSRLLAFFFACESLEKPIYGLPADELHETKVSLPQVVLWFREKTNDAKLRGSYPTRARVSFRVKDDLTESEARQIASKIKQTFGIPKYSFKKGELKISYRDLSKGYEFIIAAFNESEAKELITKTLSLRNDTPDWELLSNSESGKNFKTKKYKTILGKRMEMPNYRPIATVHFTHAELKIHGMTKDKILVDTSGYFPGAYEYVI